MEPLLPSEAKVGPLLERAHDLIRKADRLSGWSPSGALPQLRQLLRSMNSYYSNRLEGEHTLPLEIEQALRNDYSRDLEKARRQRLALAHIVAESQLESSWKLRSGPEIWSTQALCEIHQTLFTQSPEMGLKQAVVPSEEALKTGQLRTAEVSVGKHVPPLASALPAFLARWSGVYGGVRRGEMQVVAMAAAHQRLAWIHPFTDGNGRVARLHSHLILGQLGLCNGLWSLLRGFARSQTKYYSLLSAADEGRAGDLDGRGNLTEAGLIAWITYVLDVCDDQIDFVASLLSLEDMKRRIAACLNFEEQVAKSGVRASSLRALHMLFAMQSDMERADFKAMLGLGDRLASAQVSALLARGLLVSDSPYGKLRFGIPQHALRFYFPRLWPEAEMDVDGHQPPA